MNISVRSTRKPCVEQLKPGCRFRTWRSFIFGSFIYNYVIVLFADFHQILPFFSRGWNVRINSPSRVARSRWIMYGGWKKCTRRQLSHRFPPWKIHMNILFSLCLAHQLLVLCFMSLYPNHRARAFVHPWSEHFTSGLFSLCQYVSSPLSPVLVMLICSLHW